MNRGVWTDDAIATLKALSSACCSMQEIADRVGLSRGTVCGKLKRLGLTRRSRTDTDTHEYGVSGMWDKDENIRRAMIVARARRGAREALAAPVDTFRSLGDLTGQIAADLAQKRGGDA